MTPIPYVQPYFTIYNTFEDLTSQTEFSAFSLDKKSSAFQFSEFYQSRKAFILAEPGYGKSRVVQEIVDKANANQKRAASIAFNQLKDYSLNSLSEIIKSIKEGVKRSENFALQNSSDIILCLDALDEVDAFRFASVLRLITEIAEKYPAIGIYTSCRTHYVADKRFDFTQFSDFKFISISSLDTQQIRGFLDHALEENSQKAQTIDILVNRSYGYNKTSIFSIPRYLQAVVKAIHNKKFIPDQLKQLRKVDVFEIAIYEKLEGEMQQHNEVVIIKRVLEKLALVMEIAQTNQITKDELVTFLDRVHSNVNQALFSLCSIDTFIGRVLKEVGDTLEFDHTEFQEYLAAKELLRLGERDQILYDLIIEPTFLHIYSNWYDVLRYAIEIEAKTILPITNFIHQKDGQLVEDKYYSLLEIVDVDKLSDAEKQSIFETFYHYCQCSPQYISQWAETLSRFYQPENYVTCLANSPNENDSNFERKFHNQAVLIRALAEERKLNVAQQETWKIRLVKEAE